MLFACSYHIYLDSIHSYAAYVAIEVIIITTVSSTLLLIDAMSALKCWGVPNKTRDDSRYKVEGDYESEDDDPKKRLAKRKDQLEVMGGDEDRINIELRNQSLVSADYESSMSKLHDTVSKLSGNQLDENTRRQIQMLEELAR